MRTVSAYVKSPWQFELRDVELSDTPPAGQVLLRIEACGICGTDLSTAARHAREWQSFGHEIAAVVVAASAGADHLVPGQRVVLESSSFCGRCELCRNGRVDLCNKAPNIGGLAAMGFSREMIAPMECVVPYDDLAPEVACLSEPAGVAYDMVTTADIRWGQCVCVVGPGPIGLMAAALARHGGAVQVACIGRSHGTARLQAARRLGAEAIAHDGAPDQLTDLHRQFDHVLMTAPVEFIPPALSLLAYGGVLTYIGIGTGNSVISFDADDFHFRKLQLRSSYASPGIHVPRVLDLLKSGALPGEALISHRFELAEIGKAMAVCRDDKGSALKVVIRPGDRR